MIGKVVCYYDNKGQKQNALVKDVNPTSPEHATLVLADGSVLVDVAHVGHDSKDVNDPRNAWEPYQDELNRREIYVRVLRAQLAACWTAATTISDECPTLPKEDTAWCEEYQSVLDLRRKYEELLAKFNATTEAKDEQLQAVADEHAAKPTDEEVEDSVREQLADMEPEPGETVCVVIPEGATEEQYQKAMANVNAEIDAAPEPLKAKVKKKKSK